MDGPTNMDVGDGTSGTSADVRGRWSWDGVGFDLMGKNMEEKPFGIKNLKEKNMFLLESLIIW